MPRRDRLASIRGNCPEILVFIKDSADDAGVELDVLAQIKSVNDMIGIFQNICLVGIFVFPLPLLLQLFIKAVGVLQAGNITTGTRVTVPVPGTTDTAGSLAS